MNQKVEEYLANKAAQEQERRDKILVREGLYSAEALPERPENFNSEFYDYAGVQDEQGNTTIRYFRKVPLPVSEEEWAQIAKYADAGTAEKPAESNGVASALKGMAIAVYIFAFILGIALGRNLLGEFSFGTALAYWVAGAFSGTMLLGFSEVVRLLHEINQKTR